MVDSLDADKAFDYLFLCFAVLKLKDSLDKDGAAELNNILQERAGLSKEQAFAFIRDAIDSGLLTVEKISEQRKLRVDMAAFNTLRDKYGSMIPEIHSNIESSKWKFKTGIRHILNDDEKKVLQKFVSQNRVKVPAISDAKKMASDIMKNFKADMDPEVVNDLKRKFQSSVGEALTKFITDNPDKDFSLLIKKTGDKIDCSFRDVKDREKIVWAWS